MIFALLGSVLFFGLTLILAVVLLGRALKKRGKKRGADRYLWSVRKRTFATLISTLCLELIFVVCVVACCSTSLLEISTDPEARVGLLIGVFVTAAVFNVAASPLLVLIFDNWSGGRDCSWRNNF